MKRMYILAVSAKHCKRASISFRTDVTNIGNGLSITSLLSNNGHIYADQQFRVISVLGTM